MPDVKVKKSVLQSIIKKHLFESPAPDSGVPRRLTVGPDRSPLPQGLPLSPSDRMSVQLDVERPPVDDPDYMPENPRELGYAVQALAEMVPVEFVEKVYDGFKKVIEDAVEGDDDSEGEGMKMSDDVDLLNKFESFYRRSRLVNSLMSEAADDSDPEEDEAELARLEREMGAELRAQADREFKRPTVDSASTLKIREALGAVGINNTNLVDYLINQIIENRGEESTSGLTSEDFIKFYDLLIKHSGDQAIEKVLQKAIRDSNSNRDKDKWDIMVQFIQSFPQIVAKREEELLASRPGTRSDPKKFEYQTSAKKYGYAAASGLRQTFIRDILGVRALRPYIVTKEIEEISNDLIRKSFVNVFSREENQNFLETLFDEEGLPDLKSMITDPEALAHSSIFQNFAGLITYEALSNIAELNFKAHRGVPGRKISLAFQTEFGDDNKPLQSYEREQLSRMIDKDEFLDFLGDVLSESAAQGHKGLITAAALLSAEDLDAEELGRYESPAFAAVRQRASAAKPPQAYFKPDHPMFEPIKSADAAARKAAKETEKKGSKK
jgi:hypothetical protein